METVEHLEGKHHRGEIVTDDWSPWGDENILGKPGERRADGSTADDYGIAYRKDSRYTLGTVPMSSEDMARIAKDRKYLVLPVYAYVHGGATISLRPFAYPWDSGQSGIVYASKAWMKKERIRKREEFLRGQVEDCRMYLEGECYGYRVFRDSDGELVSDCYGYMGLDYVRKECRSMLTHYDERHDIELANEAERDTYNTAPSGAD